MASFGFVLGKSPFQGENIETLFHLASSALKRSHTVFVFLHKDAIFASMRSQKSVEDKESPKDLLEDLILKGCQVICSDLDIKARGVDSGRSLIDSVRTGDLSDLAEAVGKLDKIIVL